MESKPSAPDLMIRRAARLLVERRGAALVEFAIVLPVLLTLLLGIISFGSWLALAHSVQQSANEGARAALTGLTLEERAAVAKAAADTALARTSSIDLRKVSVVVQDDGATLVVRIIYDASANPLLSLSIVPLPSGPIQREAAVRLQAL